MKAKVCLVGANAGCKTSLIRAHVHDEFDDRYLQTLGTKVTLKRLRVSGVPGFESIALDLTVWDILNRKEFRKDLLAAYGEGACGILAVADMTRRQTLDELGDWIEDVENVTGPVPVVVIGANAEPGARREVSEDDVRKLAESYGAACFFASVNSKVPVEQAFGLLAERIVSHRFRERRSA